MLCSKKTSKNFYPPTKFSILFGIVLAFEFIYLIVLNFAHGTSAMDQDASKLMIHALEIVKKGKILLPGWRYMTTHEIDSAMLLALPFLALTKNAFVSFAISNTLYLFILLLVFLTILKNCNVKLDIALFTCCLVFMPYNYGMLDYVNMLFYRGSQYSVKILIPLMAVMLLTFRERNKKRDLILSAIWLFLAFLCGFSSGLFPLVTGVLPIAAVYYVNYAFKNHRKDKVTLFRTILLVLGFVANVFGFFLHQLYKISSSGINALITFSDDFGEKIFSNLKNYFDLLNALPAKAWGDYSVVSLAGVGYICRFVLAVFFLISSIRYIIVFFTGFKKQESEEKAFVITDYLSVIVLVNVLVHLLCSYDASRYYLVDLSCMMLLAGINVSKIAENTDGKAKVHFIVILALFMMFTWFTSKEYVNNCLTTKDTFGYCRDISDFIQTQDVDNVIFIDNTSVEEVCRIFLPDYKVSCYYSPSDSFVSFDWYTDTGKASYYGDSSIIVIGDDSDISTVFGPEVAASYDYLCQIAKYSIYKSEELVLPLQ